MIRRVNPSFRLIFPPFIKGEKSKGFTLIEVMVTLTILALILLIVFGAFRLGFSAREKGESIKDRYQRVRIVTQLISQQVKSAVPYKIKTQKADGDYLAFEGKAHSLKFVSALPIKSKQTEGFVYAIYEFQGRSDGRLTLFEERALNKDFFEESPSRDSKVPLMENITDVSFDYYRENDPSNNRPGGWVDDWNAKEEKELPRAVRMTITLKTGKEQKEFPITMITSLQATKYEETKTQGGLGRRGIQQRPQ